MKLSEVITLKNVKRYIGKSKDYRKAYRVTRKFLKKGKGDYNYVGLNCAFCQVNYNINGFFICSKCPINDECCIALSTSSEKKIKQLDSIYKRSKKCQI